tara:strand:- start:40 stop:1632 length:1593 start_codon:yes stop_codon:yes gene_type:complete
VSITREHDVFQLNVHNSCELNGVCYLESDLLCKPNWLKKDIPTSVWSKIVLKVVTGNYLLGKKFSASGSIQIRLPAKFPPIDPKDTNVYPDVDKITSLNTAFPLMTDIQPENELYQFQKIGVDWLLNNPRAILADDMGLGKTVQAVTAMKAMINSGEIENSLVVCPKSLQSTWISHLNEWAPELAYYNINSKLTDKERQWSEGLKRAHVLIATYEQLVPLPNALSRINPDLVVADEAHRIRNISSQINGSMRNIDSGKFWAVTGTPIERDQEDFVTLLSMVVPGLFSNMDKNMPEALLREKAKPFVLRRLKKDILDDLPTLKTVHKRLNLLPQQKQSYDLNLKHFRNNINQQLALLNNLRTICDFDPKTQESCKVDSILDIIGEVRNKGEKVIVFSYLIKPLDILRERLEMSYGHESLSELRGEQDQDVRNQMVTKFKADEKTFVLLASSRVGGEGLTLTEANHVVFFNRWWNPSNNAQARDRVHRIGQKKSVKMYTFTCSDTIEEKLDEILEKKNMTVSEVVDLLSQSL